MIFCWSKVNFVSSFKAFILFYLFLPYFYFHEFSFYTKSTSKLCKKHKIYLFCCIIKAIKFCYNLCYFLMIAFESFKTINLFEQFDLKYPQQASHICLVAYVVVLSFSLSKLYLVL